MLNTLLTGHNFAQIATAKLSFEQLPAVTVPLTDCVSSDKIIHQPLARGATCGPAKTAGSCGHVNPSYQSRTARVLIKRIF